MTDSNADFPVDDIFALARIDNITDGSYSLIGDNSNTAVTMATTTYKGTLTRRVTSYNITEAGVRYLTTPTVSVTDHNGGTGLAMTAAITETNVGSDRATNGGFDTDDDWEMGGNWEITGGLAVANNTVDGAEIWQYDTRGYGKTYRVTFTISGYSGAGGIKFRQNTVGSGVGGSSETFNSNGEKTFFFEELLSGGANDLPKIWFETVGTTTLSINDVELYEVDNVVSSLTITDGGYGYTTPAPIISIDDGGATTQATATVGFGGSNPTYRIINIDSADNIFAVLGKGEIKSKTGSVTSTEVIDVVGSDYIEFDSGFIDYTVGEATIKVHLQGGTDNSWDSGDEYFIGNFPTTGDDYLAISDPSGGNDIDIYSYGLDQWIPGVIDYGINDGGKIIYYIVDGVLRVIDSNFENENKNKWYGYIHRKRFKFDSTIDGNENLEVQLSGWYLFDQYPVPPSEGGYGNVVAQTDKLMLSWDNEDTESDAVGWNYSSAEGGNKTWEFAYSYTYDDTQETMLHRIYDSNTVGNNQGLGYPLMNLGNLSELKRISLKLYLVTTDKKGISSWNERITDINVYMRESGTSTWYHQFSANLYNGVRQPESGDYVGWTCETVGSTHYIFSADTDFIQTPQVFETFESRTDFDTTDNLLDLRFKTAVVSNRKVYVGNVKMLNKSGGYDTKGDAMMRSSVNAFDTFSASNQIEVTVNDGDQIVKLEEYADRILQFKKNKVHLINVSQEIEFLEDTWTHKGIQHPGAVCKTDFGVAWVNKLGCYLYDGQKISNLLEKQGRQIIKPSEWESFITDDSLIGYVPKKRQLIILKDSETTSDGDIYIHDMVTQSWVFGDSTYTDVKKQSNFVTDRAGDLINAYYNGGQYYVKKWTDASAAKTKVDIRTKAIAFRNPSSRKKIYKVYVTHKNCGSSQIGLYGEFHSQKVVAGQGEGQLSNDFFFGFLAPDGNANNYITQEFKVPAENLNGEAINFNSVYTLRLYILTYKAWTNAPSEPGATLNGTAPENFAINDISIVFRAKRIN